MRMVASKYGFEFLNILFSLKCFLASLCIIYEFYYRLEADKKSSDIKCHYLSDLISLITVHIRKRNKHNPIRFRH